jgi:hypothetical protein
MLACFLAFRDFFKSSSKTLTIRSSTNELELKSVNIWSCIFKNLNNSSLGFWLLLNASVSICLIHSKNSFKFLSIFSKSIKLSRSNSFLFELFFNSLYNLIPLVEVKLNSIVCKTKKTNATLRPVRGNIFLFKINIFGIFFFFLICLYLERKKFKLIF